jgi:hypothetical protein
LGVDLNDETEDDGEREHDTIQQHGRTSVPRRVAGDGQVCEASRHRLAWPPPFVPADAKKAWILGG